MAIEDESEADRWTRPPSLREIEHARSRIAPFIVPTPVFRWGGPIAEKLFGAGTEVWVKLELFQVTGSFKVRGALNTALQLSPDALRRGLTTFSSGNHAAAVAYAAQVLGTSAKVVMLERTNPARLANCRRFGGEVVTVPSGLEAVEMVQRIAAREGRAIIHPYEGPATSAGAATVGFELHAQVPALDAVIVAVGGGGLCSGVGIGTKLIRPDCEVLGVQPEGADTMYRSFRSGRPETAGVLSTIADSLAPPHMLPYSMALCRQTLDDLVLIDDGAMSAAMYWLLSELKLVVEPGGAASAAGLMGPFRDRLAGRRVGVVTCGSNIDLETFHRYLPPSDPS